MRIPRAWGWVHLGRATAAASWLKKITILPLEGWSDVLYQPVGQAKTSPLTIMAVPFSVWCNRGLVGKMAVWIDAMG